MYLTPQYDLPFTHPQVIHHPPPGHWSTSAHPILTPPLIPTPTPAFAFAFPTFKSMYVALSSLVPVVYNGVDVGPNELKGDGAASATGECFVILPPRS